MYNNNFQDILAFKHMHFLNYSNKGKVYLNPNIAYLIEITNFQKRLWIQGFKSMKSG